MTHIADPRVDAYISALPDWQQAIFREVRDLIHAADPEVTETIKRADRPYFVLGGNICALLAANEHVNVFPHAGAIVADPEGIVTSGHDNKSARTVAIQRGQGQVKPSTPPFSPPCSGTLLPITVSVAGARSSARGNPFPRQPGIAPACRDLEDSGETTASLSFLRGS